jgi:hypothetical protein
LFREKCSVRSETLVKIDFLMYIIASRDENIEELTSLKWEMVIQSPKARAKQLEEHYFSS